MTCVPCTISSMSGMDDRAVCTAGGMGSVDQKEGEFCVICGHAGRGDVAPFHMTHGVIVSLCATHRAPAFLRRRRGRIFVERLERLWRAGGSLTVRKLRALDAHRRRMLGPRTANLPGSYSWPDLRDEAEVRFAAGEDPAAVIEDLRRRFAAWPARVPSARTMRRWHAEGRWFTQPPRHGPRPTFLGIRRPLRSDWSEAMRSTGAGRRSGPSTSGGSTTAAASDPRGRCAVTRHRRRDQAHRRRSG